MTTTQTLSNGNLVLVTPLGVPIESGIFDDIPDPSFSFGNSQDIHAMLLDRLRALASSVSDTVDTDSDLARKGYVQSKLASLHSGDNTSTNAWSGANDYSGQLTIKTGGHLTAENGAIVTVTSTLELSDGCKLMCVGPNTSITDVELSCLHNVSSNTQDQIAAKQDRITNFTSLTCNNLNASSIQGPSITDNGSLNCSGGIVVSSGQVSLPSNSLSISNTNGLQSALDSKQATITSATDLTLHNISCNQLTCSAGEIDYSDFACSGVATLNNLSVSGTITLPVGSISQSSVSGLSASLAGCMHLTGAETVAGIKTFSTAPVMSGASITSGTIPDAALVSTFLKSSSALDGSKITNASIPDTALSSSFVHGTGTETIGGIKTFSTAPVMSGASITSGTIQDTSLASTFLKSSSALDGSKLSNASVPDTALVSSFMHLNGAETVAGIKTFSNPPVMSGVSITSGSIPDAALASTFLKSSSALDGSKITNASIPDTALSSSFVHGTGTETIGGIKTFSTAPVMSGASITSATIPDTALVSSFLKSSSALSGGNITNASVPDTALVSSFMHLTGAETVAGIKTFSSPPVMSGASITSATIPTTSIASGALVVTSLSCTSETDSGNGTFSSLSEKITTQGNNGTTNSYTLDYTTNTAVYALSTAPTGNFTVRFNNCGSDTTKTINFAVLYNSKYWCTSVSAYSDTSTQITLASSTPIYAGGAPTSIASGTILLQTFSLVRSFAGSYYVLSNVIPYY